MVEFADILEHVKKNEFEHVIKECNIVNICMANKFIKFLTVNNLKFSRTNLDNFLKLLNDSGIYPNIETCDIMKRYKFECSTIQYLLNYGLEQNDELLLFACKNHYFDAMKTMYENKFIPTNEHFKQIITEEIVYDDNYTVANLSLFMFQSYINTIAKNIHNINGAVETLIDYGYVLTFEDVIFATKQHIKLDIVDKIHMKLPIEFTNLCHKLNFNPQYIGMEKAVYDSDYLKFLCLQSKTNTKEITRVLKSGVKPTRECFIIAAKKNLTVIKLFIKHGFIVDLNILENCLNINRNKKTKLIFNTYKTNIENQNKANQEENIMEDNQADNDDAQKNIEDDLDDVDNSDSE